MSCIVDEAMKASDYETQKYISDYDSSQPPEYHTSAASTPEKWFYGNNVNHIPTQKEIDAERMRRYEQKAKDNPYAPEPCRSVSITPEIYDQLLNAAKDAEQARHQITVLESQLKHVNGL